MVSIIKGKMVNSEAGHEVQLKEKRISKEKPKENFETLKSPQTLVSSVMTSTMTKKRKLEPLNKQTEEQTETSDQRNQANGNHEVEYEEGHEEELKDEPIQDLLEPFAKEQLLDLLNQAAENHPDVADRIREVADEDPSHRKIFVHGLGWDTKTETLIEAFKQYGEIEDCKAVFDKVSGKSKGYGFILFKSRSGARNALKQPQKKIGSRTASCQLACKGPVFGGNAVEGLSTEHTQRKIYVSNVGAELDPEKLLAFFSRFGEVEEGPLGLDKVTGRPKGFCLFVYKSAESAKRALQEPHKTFEGHVLHCQKAIDGPKPGKQQQFNPRYGAPGGHGHLMASNQAPAQGMDPAIGQALALLVSQGAGLAFNPALGQALLGAGMPTGYGTQGMTPGAIPGYGAQLGLQGGYQTPPPGQGGKGRGQHGVGQYSPYMGH